MSSAAGQTALRPEGRGDRQSFGLYRKYVEAWLAFRNQGASLSSDEVAIALDCWDDDAPTQACAAAIRAGRGSDGLRTFRAAEVADG